MELMGSFELEYEQWSFYLFGVFLGEDRKFYVRVWCHLCDWQTFTRPNHANTAAHDHATRRHPTNPAAHPQPTEGDK